MGGCWTCGGEVREDWLNCPHCGATGIDEGCCPKCGSGIDEAWSFCPGCGYNRGDGIVQDEVAFQPVITTPPPIVHEPSLHASMIPQYQLPPPQEWQQVDEIPAKKFGWGKLLMIGLIILFVIIRVGARSAVRGY